MVRHVYRGEGPDDEVDGEDDNEFGHNEVYGMSAQEFVVFSPVQDQMAVGAGLPNPYSVGELGPIPAVRASAAAPPEQEDGRPVETQLHRVR